jgi:hypothetical protein
VVTIKSTGFSIGCALEFPEDGYHGAPVKEIQPFREALGNYPGASRKPTSFIRNDWKT